MEHTEQAFMQAFKGQFWGVLRWEQLDTLWEAIRVEADKGWYIYALGEGVPQSPASAEQVRHFIQEIDGLLRQEHTEDYCGIVYADDLKKPRFVKIFDPNQLGSVCGSSGQTILPGWLLCQIKPTYLSAVLPTTQSRKRWWRRLFN
ncbi:MAG: hypothetical protein WAQ53_16095 [Thiofilum sp.]|uniref:hypothetical protein n=1 Tax=Thiofilum sp. TaxID=2212733 RepID=UPI0025D00B21|nr:hypothetical protein [Thiofilum sp.]MBK8452371.1 hypothetical protein [Thiofilum sp.]